MWYREPKPLPAPRNAVPPNAPGTAVGDIGIPGNAVGAVGPDPEPIDVMPSMVSASADPPGIGRSV